MNSELENVLLQNYQRRKKWYGQKRFHTSSELFEIETIRAAVKRGHRILEIGFGDGRFLDWAKNSGYKITGVEINSTFAELADERGHSVYLGDANTIFKEKERLFDLICFFDVLEHLNLVEIVEILKTSQRLLKKNGKILAKFPNGLSPFGRVHQHGDATHKSTLSGPIMEDLASIADLKVLSVQNSARSMKLGRHRFPILKKIAYLVRDIIQAAIGYIYFGENIPMDPNITVIMGKR